MKLNKIDLLYLEILKKINNFCFDVSLYPYGIEKPLTPEELNENITFDFETKQTFSENIYFSVILSNWNTKENRIICNLYIKDNNGRLKSEHLEAILFFIQELQKKVKY